MEDFFDGRTPAACHSVGLDCCSCVGRSAEAVAAICRGLSMDGVSKIFGELYPANGCAPMMIAFQTAYLEASAPRKPVVRAVAAA